MLSILNLLFPLVLSLTSPAPAVRAPVAPAPTVTAATPPPRCPCDIGHKSW